MTKKEAYEILGVSPTSSSLEIKKAFHQLSKKYHPDSYEGRSAKEREYAVEQMKKISLAYRCLEPKKKKEKTQEELRLCREEKIQLLNDLIECDAVSLDKTQYAWFYQNMKEILDDVVAGMVAISKLSSQEEINQLFSSLKQKVLKFYHFACEKYILQNHISRSLLIQNPINYDCNINFFVKQLETLLQRSKNMCDDIEREMDKYRCYAGYDEIKDKIEAIVKKYSKQILVNEGEKTNLIQQMNQRIEALFSQYFDQKTKLEKLMKVSVDFMSVDEMNRICFLQNKLGTKEFEREYEMLRYLLQKQVYSDHQDDTKVLYSYLQQKAFQEIERLSFLNDLNRIGFIKNLEQYILLIFDQVRIGRISYEKLQKLAELTFVDFEFDFNILWELRSVFTADDIYIQKYLKEDEEADQIRWLENEFGLFYLCSFCPGYADEVQRIKYLNHRDILEEQIPFLEFCNTLKPSFCSTNYGDLLYVSDFYCDAQYCCFLEEDIISIQLLPLKDIIICDTSSDLKNSSYRKEENFIAQIVNQVNVWSDDQMKMDFHTALNRSRKKL